MNNVIDFINTNRDRYVDELKEYLAIPSISALPEHAPDVKRAAEWSADEMRRIGMQNRRLPVNIKIILEGEEEVGSANLDNFVKNHKDDLRADVVVISDSPMFDRGIPSICYGLRGLVYFQIDLRGTKSDLHSGSFGGAVANPAMVLANVLAQMKDRGGRIKIPGFYEDVRELREEERDQWKRLPFNEKKFKKDFGIPKLFGES